MISFHALTRFIIIHKVWFGFLRRRQWQNCSRPLPVCWRGSPESLLILVNTPTDKSWNISEDAIPPLSFYHDRKHAVQESFSKRWSLFSILSEEATEDREIPITSSLVYVRTNLHWERPTYHGRLESVGNIMQQSTSKLVVALVLSWYRYGHVSSNQSAMSDRVEYWKLENRPLHHKRGPVRGWLFDGRYWHNHDQNSVIKDIVVFSP